MKSVKEQIWDKTEIKVCKQVKNSVSELTEITVIIQTWDREECWQRGRYVREIRKGVLVKGKVTGKKSIGGDVTTIWGQLYEAIWEKTKN